ncbi:hypothetical protein E4U50_003191 [Claviceps purpurea]|nr:hypothetical protein E4U50_003191 [Claviceps purpurea]
MGFCTGGVIAVPVAAEIFVSLFCQTNLDEASSEACVVTAVAYCFKGRYSETLQWAIWTLGATRLSR